MDLPRTGSASKPRICPQRSSAATGQRRPVRGPLSKVMALPEKLRKTLERRMIEQGFYNYRVLAELARQQGYEISVKSLQRYGMRLARDLDALRLARAQARAIAETLPGGAGAMTERLMLSAQQKLCMTLAEVDQPEQGDMSRLARAVAHLTQAALSQQRWNDEPPVQEKAGEGRSRWEIRTTWRALPRDLAGAAHHATRHRAVRSEKASFASTLSRRH
jgi:hypothetical protein